MPSANRPFDIDPIEGNFFKGEDMDKVGEFLITVFSRDEIAAMPLDTSASKQDKLAQLQSIAEHHLANLKIPTPPPADLAWEDFITWRTTESLLAHLQNLQGASEAAIARYRMLIAAWAARPSTKGRATADLGSMNNLCEILAQHNQLAEAEKLTRALIPLEEDHPRLGKNSPQVLGARRKLMEVLAKQGRYDEAKVLNEEGYRIIDTMKDGPFAGYEEEEIEAMDEVRDNLVQWSAAAA